MKHKIISKLFIATAILFISLSFTYIHNEPDPLHKRTFNTSLSETKNGVVAKKVISDKLYFKNGKLYSDFLYEKFGYRYISYRINKDTIYTDFTNTEIRQLEVEAVLTDDNNQSIFLNFTTSEWDIDGVIKITKNDKLKRYYDFAGREKGGKPKKEKKKNNNPVFEIHS
ncbi:MAG: hypothetical protein Q7W45_02200 [Bacteroidota bacterium]|nr:hypothetical protein [Bacteroidota bacterium]MDP3145937.1 hypothetical protein [Bacteroidota bacterium]MDP3558572.1 hypothetical protein [Bacteroidota bacterium]